VPQKMTQSEIPLSKLLLRFECKNLPNLDTFSLSDCQIWAHIKDRMDQWQLIGRTEIIKDNLNPVFATPIPVDYYFEEVQMMKFVVVDIDRPIDSLVGQDMVGDVQLALSDIVGSRAQSASRKILHPIRPENGILIIRAEEIKDMQMNVKFNISATHLDKKDFLGKSDPYLEISKESLDGSWVLVRRTEVIKQNLNPQWVPFELPLATLMVNNNPNTNLRFQVFDWDNDGKSDFIGDFIAKIDDIKNKNEWELVNPKKRKKNKKYKNSGILIFREVQMIKQYSFLDYIMGGTQINLVVAIDYTASNGDPGIQNSLHYINPNGALNQYAQVISTVGNILLAYDSDGKVPVFGFGAKLPDGQVSHCFNVNGTNNPDCLGVQGILQAYYNSFYSGVKLYGPTNFAPIIAVASEIARNLHQTNEDLQAYLILLIITDGEITDMQETIRGIVDSSYLPMSIVIVGVGSGTDFGKMNVLDGDTNVLRYGTKVTERDIVQFVPFNSFNGNLPALASATLAEIPQQFLTYMKKHGINPKPPLTENELQNIQNQQIKNLIGK